MGRSSSGVVIRGGNLHVSFTHAGQRYRKSLKENDTPLPATPANIRYANKLVQAMRQQIARGTFDIGEYFPDAKLTPSTIGALADSWLSSRGTLTPATRDQYATACRFWKRLLGERTHVHDITYRLLMEKIGGYPWPSAKTHNNYLIALRGMLALEYHGANATKNPAADLPNMAAVKRLPDPLTVAERDGILAHMRKHYPTQVWAYFQFAFYTGMRPEEMIALRWEDWDQAEQQIRVQRVRTFKGSEREGSKTHTVRDVHLLPQAVEALTAMKPFTFLARGDIFQNPVTGRPWHDERSQRDTFWKPTLLKMGIRFRRQYNTRHTYATVALMAGVPPAYIANQLGHSVQMLLTNYARWINGSDAGAARRLMQAAMGTTLAQTGTDQT